MTESTAAVMVSDSQGEQAFKHYDRLLGKVQVGSTFRARGQDLRAAKKAYDAYLPILQPIGQTMLDRALRAVAEIKSRLEVPQGYVVTDNTHDSGLSSAFVAGRIQLNKNASLYIKPATEPDSESLGAEIRVFTQSVRAFVPMWIGMGPVSGRTFPAEGGSEFIAASSYDELVEKVVAAVNDSLARFMELP